MNDIDSALKIVNTSDKEIGLYGSIYNLIYWDEETHMPKAGSNLRAEQRTFIELKKFDLINSKELMSAVNFLKLPNNYSTLLSIDKRKIDLFHDAIEYDSRLTSDFVEKQSLLEANLYTAWMNAKPRNSFTELIPNLTEMFELKKQESKLVDPESHHPYNVMLENYEEGLTVEVLDKLFFELKKELIPVLKNVYNSKSYNTVNSIDLINYGPFDFDKQFKLTEDIAKRILSDTDRYNLALMNGHPSMTAIGVDDCRVSTAAREDPIFSFGTTVHESGHALYAMGIDKKFDNSILNTVGYGFDESQSRFWENIICNSEPFWKGYYKHFVEAFPKLENISPKQFYVAANKNKKSPIRLETDELSYPMHIIIRYEIEKGIFENKIKVEDLEDIWSKKYEEYLGIKPANSIEGVLQDCHWYCGMVGYFPSYNAGSIYASTIYNKILETYPDTEKDIENLDFTNIRNWLNKNIHQPGNSLTTKEIMIKACGKDLDAKDYVSYLKNKYYSIYDIKE